MDDLTENTRAVSQLQTQDFNLPSPSRFSCFISCLVRFPTPLDPLNFTPKVQ